ncbi:imidazole glycerol phosphate synthase subunit HisH [candidate division WOR-3 bacterium 4484_100]|uniref:Imidazole glycerol phosphate synthase subunit HisH n=1 Tax=candidate division WOR-3 bacterium 4484_100 TaxID=1936077 RepID=A0A1V4QGW4_UNCW3|nr:MAG: imidazole glycerol phosphate synthase subunit HisH [candidate division WOR-3 bacterium 4484_100]
MIGIVDYGAGNLYSIVKAFDHLGFSTRVIKSVDDVLEIERVVMPGVGAFSSAIDGLKSKGLFSWLRNWIETGKPFLGICLGMQVLFETSDEAKNIKGLGIFPGRVRRLNAKKVPHIGWNQVLLNSACGLFKGIPSRPYFYFLHSYYVPYQESDYVQARTVYEVPFVSVLARGNLYAVQFHPEKSGGLGLRMLDNWVRLC